jgi:hypothetical protein
VEEEYNITLPEVVIIEKPSVGGLTAYILKQLKTA